jgi:arylsulfatase A-like enzyme
VKPNIIVILADDLGWSDTTLYGTTRLFETPNLDRLARRGMVFSRGYSASPLCSPARASILTGQNPGRCGITFPVCHDKTVNNRLQPAVEPTAPPSDKALQLISSGALDTRLPTLGKMLQGAGFATGHFGKWHLGHPPYSPLEHGFEVDIPAWPGPGPGGSFVAPWRDDFRLKPNFPKEHIEDRMAQEAVQWMTRVKEDGRPFFLQYWAFSVHTPFDAKPDLIAKYAKKVNPDGPQNSATYAAMVESLDDAVGTILDAVDRLGIADRTVIFFLSDNGGNMYNAILEEAAGGELYVASPTSNFPLRGGKGSVFEGGIRVPFVVVWPGVAKPGSRSDAIVQSTDLYPTILDGLGVAPPKDYSVDGINIRPALEGGSLARPGGIITYFPHWSGVLNQLPPAIVIHKDQWKLIRVFHYGADTGHAYFLFDLDRDVGETVNLAEAKPDVVRVLDAQIEDFLKSANILTPQPNPNFDPAKFDPSKIGYQTLQILLNPGLSGRYFGDDRDKQSQTLRVPLPPPIAWPGDGSVLSPSQMQNGAPSLPASTASGK